MNSLRKLVAGPKVRTVENGFDLDLTYVTNRVIAMAFPGSGIEALYRNSIDDVVSFITEKHGGNYMIFNLSGRKYDYSKFKGKVKEYDWYDHQAPALYTIFEICQQAANYLEQNANNVVVFHCNHGKGRTGTIIVSLLIFLNFFDNVNDALEFYAKRRFQEEGYGVTQPCQIRYIQYFTTLLKFKTIHIIPYFLRYIRFKGMFELQDIFVNARNVLSKYPIFKSSMLYKGRIMMQNKYLLMGDIFFEFVQGSLFGDKEICRLNFNTIFIPNTGYTKYLLRILTFKAHEISPDKFLKKNKGLVGEDFYLEMYFDVFCQCDSEKEEKKKEPTEEKCKCKAALSEYRIYWEKIYLILKTYKQVPKDKTIELLFGQGIHDFRY